MSDVWLEASSQIYCTVNCTVYSVHCTVAQYSHSRRDDRRDSVNAQRNFCWPEFKFPNLAKIFDLNASCEILTDYKVSKSLGQKCHQSSVQNSMHVANSCSLCLLLSVPITNVTSRERAWNTIFEDFSGLVVTMKKHRHFCNATNTLPLLLWRNSSSRTKTACPDSEIEIWGLVCYHF